MAWTDWENITAEDFMRIEYVEQANSNQSIVADEISQYLNKDVNLLPIDFSRGTSQQPYPVFLNLIEGNLRTLYQSISWPFPHEEVRCWLGELMDTPTFKYSDVNRWFNDLAYLRITVGYANRPRLISGTFTSGNTRIRQTIRRR